ncbi:MAG: Phage protein Gp37/Gp68 [Pelotomaculum sp. PtaU1.Bin035]|nr:MAG: Phage protein Gp37/Gp68 [Pelotomaculum sp. PtaU1.Bin035]
MSKSKIEWTDAVWNPVTGCSKISPGCQNCYAERMAKRLVGRCGYLNDEPFKVTLHPNRLDLPQKWRTPRRIFVNSMGDLFHPDVPSEWIERVWQTILATDKHTYLILTKRPDRMRQLVGSSPELLLTENIWLGVTAENQAAADERIPILLQIPASVRFVNVEPCLGPVDLNRWLKETCTQCGGIGRVPNHPHIPSHQCPRCKGTGKVYYPRLNWVICGGESGPGGRPMHPDWARSLRDQCQAAGVPFLFKQWGEWAPFYDRDKDDPDWRDVPKEKPGVCRINLDGGCGFHGERVVYFRRFGKKKAGRILDGRTWDEFPVMKT